MPSTPSPTGRLEGAKCAFGRAVDAGRAILGATNGEAALIDAARLHVVDALDAREKAGYRRPSSTRLWPREPVGCQNPVPA